MSELGLPSVLNSSLAGNVGSREHLLIFARLPVAGVTKTRLIPALGNELAAELYFFIAKRVLDVAKNFCSARGCRVSILFTGGSEKQMAESFGSDFEYVSQSEGSLGDRLIAASQSAFDRRASRVVIIGTDCIELSETDLHAAFDRLRETEVVLGPADDGGYYLIGTSRFEPDLFRDIAWSTESVFAQTVAAAERSSLQVETLRQLPDIDFPEDLLACRDVIPLSILPREPSRLSVVIPTLNESSNLQRTLDSIGVPNPSLEIIVVDGGSRDGTSEIAKQFGCRVFVNQPGRARQLNAGAAIATGGQLLFLHADTCLPENYREEITRVLGNGAVCGAFSLGIDATGIGYRLVEFGVACRSLWFSQPYGDQGFFLNSETFLKLGGFKHLPIMEDFEFIDRVRREGRVELSRARVLTSARRWKKRGIFRTTWINQLCVLRYRLGYSIESIAELYRR